MSKHLLIAFSLAALTLGCSPNTSSYRSAVTGDACEPDYGSIQSAGEEPRVAAKYCAAKSNNGHGNNEDGVDSSNPGNGGGGPNGETDQSCDGTGECIDDEIRPGDTGGADECELPPGCDDSLCCDTGDDDDGDGGGGGDGGVGDGGGGGGGGGEGDGGYTCQEVCSSTNDCGAESTCSNGCCQDSID